ncbi:MAG TPA: ABC transporter permease [Bryobacteraceae bacterium]|jgi:putative ABC transport system permease protein|nr:ABC transporter permease [Bryobacteraceae bacterium]
MKSIEQCKQGMRAIVRFRRRSVFMMAGIAIGVATLSVLNSIGENTRRDTVKRVKNMLGTFDTVMVRPGGKTRGMVSLSNVDPSLKFEDAAAIAREIAGVKQVARLQNAFDIDVSYRDQQISPAVFGVSDNWLALRGDEVEQGSFVSAEDDRRMMRVAVIGSDVRKSLFQQASPIGKTIRIGGVPFEVKGVLASRGAGPAGASLDNIVIIPVSTASRRLFNRDFLTMIIAQVKDPDDSTKVAAAISRLLRERHQLAPGMLDDFNITDPQAVLAQLTNVNSTLTMILRGVAFLGMFGGGVVIMALMTLGVSERRREIGLRQSVGANRGDILFQFLFEAFVVASSGGLFGAAVSWGGVEAVAAYQKLPAVFDQQALLASIALAAIVGVVFGSYPAWKASRVDPVAALRS